MIHTIDTSPREPSVDTIKTTYSIESMYTENTLDNYNPDDYIIEFSGNEQPSEQEIQEKIFSLVNDGIRRPLSLNKGYTLHALDHHEYKGSKRIITPEGRGLTVVSDCNEKKIPRTYPILRILGKEVGLCELTRMSRKGTNKYGETAYFFEHNGKEREIGSFMQSAAMGADIEEAKRLETQEKQTFQNNLTELKIRSQAIKQELTYVFSGILPRSKKTRENKSSLSNQISPSHHEENLIINNPTSKREYIKLRRELRRRKSIYIRWTYGMKSYKDPNKAGLVGVEKGETMVNGKVTRPIMRATQADELKAIHQVKKKIIKLLSIRAKPIADMMRSSYTGTIMDSLGKGFTGLAGYQYLLDDPTYSGKDHKTNAILEHIGHNLLEIAKEKDAQKRKKLNKETNTFEQKASIAMFVKVVTNRGKSMISSLLNAGLTKKPMKALIEKTLIEAVAKKTAPYLFTNGGLAPSGQETELGVLLYSSLQKYIQPLFCRMRNEGYLIELIDEFQKREDKILESKLRDGYFGYNHEFSPEFLDLVQKKFGDKREDILSDINKNLSQREFGEINGYKISRTPTINSVQKN